jgi:hypothetical protein
MTEHLGGVTRRTERGRAVWRYHGRLVARELDRTHIVIRAGFDARDALLQQHQKTFSLPPRFVRHMMIVADLQSGDEEAIAGALAAARDLQSAAD